MASFKPPFARMRQIEANIAPRETEGQPAEVMAEPVVVADPAPEPVAVAEPVVVADPAPEPIPEPVVVVEPEPVVVVEPDPTAKDPGEKVKKTKPTGK